MKAYNFIDMTGWKMWEHGVPDSKLTVIERAPNGKNRRSRWICECNCEEHKRIIADGSNIRSGNTNGDGSKLQSNN